MGGASVALAGQDRTAGIRRLPGPLATQARFAVSETILSDAYFGVACISWRTIGA